MRFALLLSLLTGCAIHGPLVADVACPRGTTRISATKGEHDGQCTLPDGKKHGPTYSVDEHGTKIDNYDHGVLAGPWAHYDARGRLRAHGYRPGVTDSLDTADDLGESAYDSPEKTGRLIVPSRVRLFPVDGDVAFSASTLVSADGHPTSSFLGALIDINVPPPARLRFRGDAYRAYFVSYGVQAAAGVITRTECDDPTIAGSGGFCGSRWMVGPQIRIGYVSTRDAKPSGALPMMVGYGRLGFLIGQDQWSSPYSNGTALVWRVRAGAGYTALGSVLSLARRARTSEAWRWLLVPLVTLVEHAEAYVDLGGDGTSALGVGAGVDIGFGL